MLLAEYWAISTTAWENYFRSMKGRDALEPRRATPFAQDKTANTHVHSWGRCFRFCFSGPYEDLRYQLHRRIFGQYSRTQFGYRCAIDHPCAISFPFGILASSSGDSSNSGKNPAPTIRW